MQFMRFVFAFWPGGCEASQGKAREDLCGRPRSRAGGRADQNLFCPVRQRH